MLYIIATPGGSGPVMFWNHSPFVPVRLLLPRNFVDNRHDLVVSLFHKIFVVQEVVHPRDWFVSDQLTTHSDGYSRVEKVIVP